MQQVSDFELELMKVIWSNGDMALYSEITAALHAKHIPAGKNTIISLLSRLVDKGFLKVNKIGRRNQYTALVSASEYQSAQTETFLDKIYEGNVRELITTLIHDERISPEDYQELKNFWEGNRKQNE